jgi:hypothetical protein
MLYCIPFFNIQLLKKKIPVNNFYKWGAIFAATSGEGEIIQT